MAWLHQLSTTRLFGGSRAKLLCYAIADFKVVHP
jgi:hypothetical protein